MRNVSAGSCTRRLWESCMQCSTGRGRPRRRRSQLYFSAEATVVVVVVVDLPLLPHARHHCVGIRRLRPPLASTPCLTATTGRQWRGVATAGSIVSSSSSTQRRCQRHLKLGGKPHSRSHSLSALPLPLQLRLYPPSHASRWRRTMEKTWGSTAPAHTHSTTTTRVASVTVEGAPRAALRMSLRLCVDAATAQQPLLLGAGRRWVVAFPSLASLRHRPLPISGPAAARLPWDRLLAKRTAQRPRRAEQAFTDLEKERDRLIRVSIITAVALRFRSGYLLHQHHPSICTFIFSFFSSSQPTFHFFCFANFSKRIIRFRSSPSIVSISASTPIAIVRYTSNCCVT